MNRVAKFKHWLAHLTGWNLGTVVTKYDNSGNLWVGFECSACGKISGASKTGISRKSPK